MTDNQAKGGVSKAEVEAAETAWDAERCRLNEQWHGGRCAPISEAAKRNVRPMLRAALEAAAQVRSAQDHGDGANEMIGAPLYTEADAENWQSEMDNRMADYSKLGDAYNAVVRDLAAAEARAAKAMEALAKWQKTGHILLMAGEMTRQELRSVKAVASGIQRDVTATLLSDHPAPEPGVGAGEVRNAALEEAAKVADAHWDGMVVPEARGGSEIAAAIRALQTPANGGRDGR